MLSCGSPLMSRIEYCRKSFVANCFRNNFGKKKQKKKELNEPSEMYRKKITNIAKITNSTRIANCSKTLLQILVAILAKICLIEIACRNLVFKSAKIAKVTRNFIAPKKHPDNYRKYMRV